MDRVLHAERIAADGGKRLHETRLADLPDGRMIGEDGRAWLLLSGELVAWSPFGYDGKRALPISLRVQVLMPPSVIDVLRAGYEPGIHATAWCS
jgi:hypothetical protein